MDTDRRQPCQAAVDLPTARAVATEPPQVPEDQVNVARLLVRISKVHKDATDYPVAMDDLAQAETHRHPARPEAAS